MEVGTKETTVVTPSEGTPRTNLWVSNIDLVMTVYHISTVYFYKPNGGSDFFDTKLLKEALSKILVSFYPIAGRLGYDENGRLQIVTTFKCGGVSIGVTSQHTLADGPSALHFINSWADTARGLSPTIAPVLDRSFLRARQPPIPKFRHVEFEPSPTLKTVSDPSIPRPSIVSIFKITAEQVKALKDKVNEASGNTKYSILTAHIWRCAIKARELADDQEIKLTIPIDGRNRLRPPLPHGYFGNVIFHAAPEALAGEIQSESFIDTYDVKTVRRGAATMQCPNLSINSWMWLPIHDADFGWGRPVFMRPANIVHEGKSYILPSPTGDGSLTLVTRLETAHMKRFGTFLYEF
ncbi:hypothetical protein V6N13_062366 [Hibiscus sabdariffa]|uniref:Uncharacterized protein n=2 Tax=Hibiscus sabdariffa TaxID=183260 RepID=A0ABR2BS46_9ROSI